MSDIIETVENYVDFIKQEGECPYITKVLMKEKEVAMGDLKVEASLYLAGNNKLVTDRRLTDKEANFLYKWLRGNLYITGLDLRYNNITDEGVKVLGKLIQESATLKNINLMNNDFGEEGAEALALSLQSNDSLISLKVNGNKIGNYGGMLFAQMLQINTTLRQLDLADCDLKTESLIALATVLNYNNTLKSLNVSRPLLFGQQEETTVHYAKMLKVNKGLTHLDMMKHDMCDFGVIRMAEHLIENFTLTHLNLSCNRITRDGAKELARLLKTDTMLEVLDLGYNRLEDDGAAHLAEALSTFNTNLKSLVLVSNNICGRGLCAIADCMKMNSSLEQVYIWGNKLEESACIAFASMVNNGRLESKNTDVEPYVVDGVTKLSELSHGIRQWYYWGPCYGNQAMPELAVFT